MTFWYYFIVNSKQFAFSGNCAWDRRTMTHLYPLGSACISGENDYIAFAKYYNEPTGRSFGNCDIYNTTITWLRKHDHMARYFPIFHFFGAKFQYFYN